LEAPFAAGIGRNMEQQTSDVDVAVVIVNYRTPDLTERCLAALAAERKQLPRLRAVVVDGASGDDSAAKLAKAAAKPDYADWVKFLPLAINGGFAWANNQAILTLAQDGDWPEFIHVLNPDTEVIPGAVVRLVEELQANPRCAAAGSELVTPQGNAAASAFYFPSPSGEFATAGMLHRLRLLLGIAPNLHPPGKPSDVDWVTGASVMFRTEALQDSGLFDDGFFLYFEEVELMHRLRAAEWTIRFVPESRVVHLEGAATGLGSGATRPPPTYWYESRRRYFALTGGAAAVLGSDAASLAGMGVAALKALLGRPRAKNGPRGRDILRFGLWPRSRDRRPSIPALGDPPGRPPAWMAAG
jgi:N-acetylglucosaminyl-diphospho-decaprenol L-rhamnosyltransferase